MYLVDAVAEYEPQNLIVSLAERPGRTGVALHNAGFAALGLPYRYVACKCEDIADDLELVRKHGVRGASVTMPFKKIAMSLMDGVTDRAAAVGAINTVVNTTGILVGHNTDVIAAEHLLAGVTKKDRVVMLGNGGCAAAFLNNLSDCTVITREDWLTRHRPRATVLINATPLGMRDEMPVSLQYMGNLRLVIDAVVGETPLIREARNRNIRVRTGVEMAFVQACEQFHLYTKVSPPISAMEIALREIYPVY